MDYDVIVAGAGPVGSMAAKYAAKNGAKALLLEEHASIGSPVSCTGHISTKTLGECELEEGPFINTKIRGAFVYSPDCNSIKLDGGRTMTYVVERKLFDMEIAKAAAAEGAEISVSTSVRGYRKIDGGVSVSVVRDGKKAAITSRVLIGADGVKSKVARVAGLGQVPHICSAIQVEANYEPRDPEFVEIFTGRDYAPGCFAWAVPTSGDCCRVGLIADGNAHVYLKRLLEKHAVVSKKARCAVDLIVGGVPVGTLKRSVSDGVMIVGDAAGHVKPVSYGGVYTGTRCAKIAGEVAAKAALDGDTGQKRLMEYERRWRSLIGREISFGLKFRDIYSRMADSDINEAMEMLSDPELIGVINKYGDIDRPSQLAATLLPVARGKRIWKFAKLFARIVL